MLDALILLLDALILLVRFVKNLCSHLFFRQASCIQIIVAVFWRWEHSCLGMILRNTNNIKIHFTKGNPNKKWLQITHQESVISRLDDEILRQTAYILHNPSLGYSLETFETWKWMPEWMSTRTMIWSSGQGWLWLTLWLPGRRHCGRIGYLQHMQP